MTAKTRIQQYIKQLEERQELSFLDTRQITLTLSDLKALLASLEIQELSAKTMLNAVLADNLQYRLTIEGLQREIQRNRDGQNANDPVG